MRYRKLDASGVHAALASLRSGTPVEQVLSAWGISVATLYALRRKYDEFPIRAIEEVERFTLENTRLAHRVKQLQLDCEILQACLDAQALTHVERRGLIVKMRKQFNVGLARVCRLLRVSRTLYNYHDAS